MGSIIKLAGLKRSYPFSWRTQGPQCHPLPFACPRAPQWKPCAQCLSCARPGPQKPPLGWLLAQSATSASAWRRFPVGLLGPGPSLALYPSEGHHKDRLPSRGDHAEPDHYNSRHPSSPAAACTPRPAWAPGSLRPSACSPNWSLSPHPAPLHSSSFTTLFFVVDPACSAPNRDRCCD